MTSVWKRLQRVGKKASKFQFVASYQELVLECTKKWQPDKLRVVWTRRNRRMCSKLHSWQPGIKNPYRGMVVWPVPENIDISVTLFKEVNADEFEDKEWTFVIEGENKGHRKVLASADINLKRFASLTPTQTDLTLKLKPLSVKVVEATLKLSLSCVFVREGKATDEDMQSLASLMSVKPTDIGNLDDFNESDEDEDKKSVTATGSTIPLAQVDEETTPSRDEGSPHNSRAVANIRVSNQPIRPAQDSKAAVTENKAEPARISLEQKTNEKAGGEKPSLTEQLEGAVTKKEVMMKAEQEKQREEEKRKEEEEEQKGTLLKQEERRKHEEEKKRLLEEEKKMLLLEEEEGKKEKERKKCEEERLLKTRRDKQEKLREEEEEKRKRYEEERRKREQQRRLLEVEVEKEKLRREEERRLERERFMRKMKEEEEKMMEERRVFEEQRRRREEEKKRLLEEEERKKMEEKRLKEEKEKEQQKMKEEEEKRVEEEKKRLLEEEEKKKMEEKCLKEEKEKEQQKMKEEEGRRIRQEEEKIHLKEEEERKKIEAEKERKKMEERRKVEEGKKREAEEERKKREDEEEEKKHLQQEEERKTNEAEKERKKREEEERKKKEAEEERKRMEEVRRKEEERKKKEAEEERKKKEEKRVKEAEERIKREEEEKERVLKEEKEREEKENERLLKKEKERIERRKKAEEKRREEEERKERLLKEQKEKERRLQEEQRRQEEEKKKVEEERKKREEEEKRCREEKERMKEEEDKRRKEHGAALICIEANRSDEDKQKMKTLVFSSLPAPQLNTHSAVPPPSFTQTQLPAPNLPPPDKTGVTFEQLPSQILSQSQDRETTLHSVNKPSSASDERSHREDAAEVDAPVTQEHQPITAKDTETPHIVPTPAEPGAPPVKEEPKEPEGPSVEPETSPEVSPKPAAEHTALALEPLLPSKPEPGLRPEQVLQPSGKPQQEGADEEKPAEVVAGGLGSFTNNKEPVCEAEKQLWATVEETTAETGRGMESSEEKDEKQEEGGVIGGAQKGAHIEADVCVAEQQMEAPAGFMSAVVGVLYRGYETVASILQTTGPADAGHPQRLLICDGQPSLHEVDAEMLRSSEPDDEPPTPIGVDISPPVDFSDTTEDLTITEQRPSHGLSLVASLRMAASEQEKEREEREKERIENMKREEREREEREEADRKEKERVEKEREEMERERMEREEEERKRLEKERKELENKLREERERAEKERKQHIEEENEKRKMEREMKRRVEEDRVRQREEDSKREILSGSTSRQEVMKNQSNDWPPLKEAELDDIAYDERLQGDEEQSENKSDPKVVKTNTEVKVVSPRPADSVPAAGTISKLDSRTVKPEDSVIAVKKALDKPGLRSVKKSNLKSGAIPVWMREEEEDEEVEYERGQEDLGSVWLAELYMEGEAG